MHDFQNHTGLIDPFKVQNRPVGFNLTEDAESIGLDSDCTLC